MWQSHLEIEHYCVASFDCITTSITPNNTAFVHHIIVYLCGALVNITEGTSSECTGQITLDPINECRRGTCSLTLSVSVKGEAHTRCVNA